MSSSNAANNMAACAICLDEKPEDPVEVSGDIVCAECVHEDIMPLFYKAVEHESNYPVRPWGEAEELDPEDFVDFFDDLGEADEFIEEWTIKVWEYSTLRKDRLYCSGCGIFVENKRFPMLVSGNSVACDKCSTETCVTCGNDATRRNCRRQSCVPREADMSAFDGLIKGKDWQTCPNVNCETPVQLLDGCNGMLKGRHAY